MRWRSASVVGRIARGIAAEFFDAPGVQVHEIAAVVLIAANVEVDLHLISGVVAVGQGRFVLHALKFDHLRVLPVLALHHEFALGEAAFELLDVINVVDGSFEFVTGSHNPGTLGG